MSQVAHVPDVLTVEEAACYLQLPKKTVRRLAALGQLPARQIERRWRFLKAALDDWLRGQDGKTILLRQVGAFADDETLPQLRKAIY